MLIHVLSDLHNEFACYTPSPSAQTAEVVVLAGDIDVRERGVAWAAENFRCPVLYVPGNHEYYKGNLQHTLHKLRDAAAATSNVSVLDCDTRVIDGVRFLGATGWTDYTAAGNQPLAVWEAETTMSDFRRIKAGRDFRRVRATDLIRENVTARKWLNANLRMPFNGPTVVITHHAPVMASLGGGRQPGLLDASYANTWEDLMGLAELWIHGHSHRACDFELDRTRVVANPRGYPSEPTGFNPDLLLTV